MISYGRAICYSGYRANQGPGLKIYPSYEQVLEDLRLLEPHFDYLRMYDHHEHAHTTLKVIRDHNLHLKVLLGVEPKGEISNPDEQGRGFHSYGDIVRNKQENFSQLDEVAALCNQYEDIVLAVSVGNESTAGWQRNLMDPLTIAEHVKYLKQKITKPVTFCEGAGEWVRKGTPIAAEVDFISIHSYPLWYQVPFANAVAVTIKDYRKVVAAYPGKQVIFTEFGWTTTANDRMIAGDANEENQKHYLETMLAWSESEQVTMFVFEAFDEPWKGSGGDDHPEKHWGLIRENRTPKLYFSERNNQNKEKAI